MPIHTREQRQHIKERVAQLMLKCLNASEIQRILGNEGISRSIRQIKDDLSEVRNLYAQTIRVNQLYNIREAVEGLFQDLRESWALYHRKPEKILVGEGEKAHEIELDDTLRKNTVMLTILKIQTQLQKLAGFTDARSIAQEALPMGEPRKLKTIEEIMKDIEARKQ